jgi:chemotaxis protein CheC
MELTAAQKDSLTELINIGYGRAAGVLSELTGYRILLEVPQVTIHTIDEIAPILARSMASPVASVNQVFSGPISGNALLLLDEPSAMAMSNLLSEEKEASADFDANAREIITEVGNILLNACLGIFGNLLQIQVTFSVPHLTFEHVTKALETVSEQSEETVRYGLMIHTRFHVKTADVTGYLVIVLSVASFDRLLIELKNWEARQIQ